MKVQEPKSPPVVERHGLSWLPHEFHVVKTVQGLPRLTPQSPPSASATWSQDPEPVQRSVPLSCVPPRIQRDVPKLWVMYSNSETTRPLLQCCQVMPRSGLL